MKKIMLCFTPLGAGIAMLANISVGKAAGNAISAAIINIARQPAIADVIREELMLTLSKIRLLSIVSFTAAIILLILSIVFCVRNIKGKPFTGYSGGLCVGISGALGAGITLLGSSGWVVGIGQAGAALLESIARNPSIAELLIQLYNRSLPLLIHGIWACAFIAFSIILIMIILQCRWSHHYRNSIGDTQ